MAAPSRIYDRDYAGTSEDAVAVSLASTDYTAHTFRRLYVGGTGDVKITTAGGNDVVYTAVPAGTYLHIQGSKIFKTGTTATLIVAEF